MSNSSKYLDLDDLLPSWRLNPEISDVLGLYSTIQRSTAGAQEKGVRP